VRWSRLAGSDGCVHVSGDVSDPSVVVGAFARADSLGTPDLVANCAGAGRFGPAGTSSRGDVDAVLAGNLVGLILFSEAAFARFRSGGGTIINALSTASRVARAGEALYCAAKWGARGYTETLQLEARGSAARVLAVYPGGMKTAFWDRSGRWHQEYADFMDPAEVAGIVVDALRPGRLAHVSELSITRT
jgi:NAD(P)-dependent dehydrogenase (short-subunit alcohol dehydrogenase family)